MKTLLRLLLKSQHQRNPSGQPQTDKGMTLVELLVGSIMAFLIITPMLGFVVDMLNTDRREQVKSNTEQDLQAAVDFIAQDLSQAIYIYDNKAINNGANAIRSMLPEPADIQNKIPILVFWKRQQIKNSVPINPTVNAKPNTCKDYPGQCNDTYVLSLVAYYQVKETDLNSTWCQPSGGNCPTRIARYEIRDGVKNPSTLAYYTDAETELGQRKHPAFNANFQISKPTENVTTPPTTTASNFNDPEVLVNYIDHSSTNVPIPIGDQCKDFLGVTAPPPPATFNASDLLITDTSSTSAHSFYACVDTSKNIARVTIRGNSLRRIQTDYADYDAKKAAYFPTASVQVQGLGARGR